MPLLHYVLEGTGDHAGDGEKLLPVAIIRSACFAFVKVKNPMIETSTPDTAANA